MREAGCTAVVFPVDCRSSGNTVLEYQRAAEKNDLMIAEVGVWKNALAADTETRRQALEYSVGQLKLADQIGARCCVNIAGTAGQRWDGAYRSNFTEQAWTDTVQMIQRVIDTADPHHTSFTIEPMPWMIPMGPDEYLRLLREVDRECFAVHMDFFNMINDAHRYFFHPEFMRECFDKLGPWIKSCHLKDVRLRDEFTLQLEETACGQGTISLESYAEQINDLDPPMPVIIEHLSSDRAYRESMAYVQKRLKAWLYPSYRAGKNKEDKL
jgi:sugar phosphate isomerase/epimerase